MLARYPLVVVAAILFSAAGSRPDGSPQGQVDRLEIFADAYGPDEQTVRAAALRLIASPPLQRVLRQSRYRLLQVDFVEPREKIAMAEDQIPPPPDRFRATIYDYTRNRTVLAEASFQTPERARVRIARTQPLPNYEEFQEAVEILAQDPEFGPLLQKQKLLPHRPMPPLLEPQRRRQRLERTLFVGLLPPREEGAYQIVGVNMVRRAVVRPPGDALAPSLQGHAICGVPDALQPELPKGTAGQALVSVFQGATLLWQFVLLRPSVSSGTRGSGVELRYLNYRGRRVLYRAHAPVVSAKYDGDVSGPWRDWVWEEGMFQTGTGGSGIQVVPPVPTTVVDSGSDFGDFSGVAVYVQGQEVVLTSEISADWYRYVSQWRLDADGTIRPRWGFTAVKNNAVCHRHVHHVYWRFDLDIRTPSPNLVRQLAPVNLVQNFEAQLFRTAASQWRVENSATGEGYAIVPGPQDGFATGDPYAKGDVWILRYRGTELDDGYNATTDVAGHNLQKFVNGESVLNADSVFWYGVHFVHDVAGGSGEGPGTYIGPELVPFNWGKG